MFADAALATQSVPFVLVITRLVPSLLTATNTPLPYVTDSQALFADAACEVHVTVVGFLSVVITRLVPSLLTATNVPTPLTVPYVTDFQLLSRLPSGASRRSQLTPLFVLAIMRFVPDLPTPTKYPVVLIVPYVTDCQSSIVDPVRIVQLIPSELVKTRLEVEGPSPTAINTPLPYVTDR